MNFFGRFGYSPLARLADVVILQVSATQTAKGKAMRNEIQQRMERLEAMIERMYDAGGHEAQIRELEELVRELDAELERIDGIRG